jgi:hypothetical protein
VELRDPTALRALTYLPAPAARHPGPCISPPSPAQVAQHVLRGHLYRQPGETSESPPVEPGIMDLMAEIKINSDYKRGSGESVCVCLGVWRGG